ncbi:MAG: T9SS type A sorting domain-containing protein [Saprospiraceae bacterium]|nr:T9SS type A sorting domain-containing protein [Saprospiraceae bacterium]
MRRHIPASILIFGLVLFSSFRTGNPDFGRHPMAFNTPMSHLFYPETRQAAIIDEAVLSMDPDTTTRMHVLLLDYTSYGSAYNEKVKSIISKYLPKTSFTEFSDGSSYDLEHALAGCEVAIVAYPSAAQTASIKSFGKVLNKFVQQGGSMIFTGTHEFEILQQFDLFDLDFGYFSKDFAVHCQAPEHPIMLGVGNAFTMTNFTYPLDISDPGFVSVAEVGGYPTIGYKPVGQGKVVYLGIEYYYDEEASSKVLVNAVNWSVTKKSPPDAGNQSITSLESVKAIKRSEEFLFAGSGSKEDQIDLKIYPNPYYNKATLDIELTKPSNVRIQMTDEMGRDVALIFPKKLLNPGLCRFELPNLSPGIYFVQIQIGDQVHMKRVVKSAAN